MASWEPSPERVTVVLTKRHGDWKPRIDHRRPDAARLVIGRPVGEVPERLARTHVLCGLAHQVAFARAVCGDHARSRDAAWELALLGEMALAHGRRAALELAAPVMVAPAMVAPAMVDGHGPLAPLRSLAATVAALGRGLGMAGIGGDITPDGDALDAAVATLPGALAAVLAATPDSPPVIDGADPALMEALNAGWRRPWDFAAGLEGRMARLVPLINHEGALGWSADTAVEGIGRATTARGDLTYHVAVGHVAVGHMEGDAGAVVTACRADTPTMALTAPGGELETALSRLPVGGDWVVVEAFARLVITALDPCAPVTLLAG